MHPQLLLDRICASLGSLQSYSDAIDVLLRLAEIDPVIESAYNRYIREQAKVDVATLASEGRFEEADELLDLIRQMCDMDAHHDLDACMQALEWDRPARKRFWQPRRDKLLHVCEAMQDLYDDRLDFLSVSLPVRTGKSTLGCFFMVFVMATRPEESNIMTGYANNLTTSFYNEVISIISDTETYRFSKLFPESPLVHKDSQMNTICLRRKRRFATMTCRSLQGSIEGAIEASSGGYLYCDDMVESYEQTLSTERMEKLYDIYSTQLRGRKKDGAKEIHIGTRWAPNDIIGEIEAKHDGDPRYRFIAVPALDGKPVPGHPLGQSNFDYPFGVGFSTEFFEDQHDDLVEHGNEHIWAAKYQASPYYKDGKLFEPSELRWYESLPDGVPDIVLAVCDTKTTGDDYCVQVIDYVYGDDHYIHAVICDDGKMTAIQPRLVSQLVAHGVNRARYESNVAGGKIASEVEGACHAQGLPLVMKTKYTTKAKETRILADEGWVKKRCLFRCDTSAGPEYHRFMTQLESYSTKGKNRHDDVPDAMSMLCRFVEATIKPKVTAFKRPW